MWLSGWKKRFPQPINAGAGSGTDYRMTLNLTAAQLNGNVRNDFGDVRFTASDGITELSYYLQSYVSGVSAVFVIRISANLNSDALMYIYCGRPSATTTSSEAATYLFWDDGSADHRALYTQRSIGNGNLGTLGYDAINHRYTIGSSQQDTVMFEILALAGTQGYEYKADYAFSTLGGVHAEFGMAVRYSASGLYYLSDYQRSVSGVLKLWIVREPNPPNAQYADVVKDTVPANDRIGTTALATAKSQNVFYTFTGRVNGGALYCAESLDGRSCSAIDSTYPSGSLGLYAFLGGPTVYYKNVKITPYTTTPPTFGTLGTEEPGAVGSVELALMLAAIRAFMDVPVEAFLTIGDYDVSYVGAVAGHSTLGGYVCVFCQTDTLSLKDIINVGAGNADWVSTVSAGVKIVENTTSAVLAADGTISGTGTAITGTGTHFETQAQAGGTIYVNNMRRWIRSIEDDTHLTLWAAVSADFADQSYSLIGVVRARTISNGTPPWLPASFKLPYTDVDYEQAQLGTRCYTYDAGLFLHICAATNDRVRGDRVVDALVETNRLTDAHLGTVGAMPFSNSCYMLDKGDEDYIQSGAAAWVGLGLVNYFNVSQYVPAMNLARKIATYLISMQVPANTPNNFQAGLITGGQDLNGRTVEAFTEHNIDCYFFFKLLYRVTRIKVYKQAYKDIEYGLMTNLYDGTLNRFCQGTTPTDKDYGEALDVYSWGGMFLLDIGETAKAQAVAARMFTKFYVQGKFIQFEDTWPDQYNQTFDFEDPVDGLRTYAETTDGQVQDSYVNPPDSMWQEGVHAAMLFLQRLGGYDVEIDTLENGQEAVYAATSDGTVLAFSSSWRTVPYAFQIWRSVSPACWWWMRSMLPEMMFPTEPLAERTQYYRLDLKAKP